MIQLRRASVIVTLSLLAWATTAYAECAWVLWATSPHGRFFPAERSVIVSGFGALADCKTEATRYRNAVTVLADRRNAGYCAGRIQAGKPEQPPAQ